jgi:hypothetical protein
LVSRAGVEQNQLGSQMTYYRSFFDQNQQIIQTRHIECCRWNNLVYVRTLKCGSEFFYKNFTQTARWTPIKWNDIDWNNDYAFSYIMDPIKRRHKGIAEFLIMNNGKDLLFNVPEFGKIICQIPCFDEHSASLHNLYGDKINHIHWLPLLSDHSVAITATNELLEHHTHPLIHWNNAFAHTTDNYMSDTYNRVKELWDSTNVINGYVRSYFEKDLELFMETKKTYDRNHGTKFSNR